ncbi:MAG: phosphoenolpyruvate synthase [Lewinella sp.]|nr:phosphoenolpyruvate synthase [Lewinella sp.]
MLLRLLLVFILPINLSHGQSDLSALVAKYQTEQRGPYKDVRWFCSNGSTRDPRDPCPKDPRARQHARLRDEVAALAKNDHLFLTQILTGTKTEDFWDERQSNSRLKQYQLTEYLAAVNDGWILRQARGYRGALQIEDEMEWGRAFFHWLLAKEESVEENFYLIRQAVRDVPHNLDTDLTKNIRNSSKRIADEYPKFMGLRIKIHNRPNAEDATAVEAFLAQHLAELEQKNLATTLTQLAQDIRLAYAENNLEEILHQYTTQLKDSPLKAKVEAFLSHHQSRKATSRIATARLTAACDLLWELRAGLRRENTLNRLALLDISLVLEQLIFRSANDWQPANARELTEKICYLSKAVAGAGFVECWEFMEAAPRLADPNYRYVWPQTMSDYLDYARRFVEWGTATNRATYQEVVTRFAVFEPLAYGFIDDRIRSSVLLPLGDAVGQLGNWVAENGKLNNALLELPNQGQVRGLNPGYARGKLHLVASEDAQTIEVNARDIYIFSAPPADLKPVGGIATVSEGNMVSHVQLLARNLGIPNAVLTAEQFKALSPYAGQEVFYAVSNAGTVLMKPAKDMNEAEKALFITKKRSETRISVPVAKLQLDVKRLLNLREVRSKDSGELCGPKAANLGQLKALFPENVVEGLVIPFGIFRSHLDQAMPGQGGQSYWQFLNSRFAVARQMEEENCTPASIEAYTLEQLALLQQAIEQMVLQPSLVNALQDSFQQVFGAPLGKVPVFLRSDTNMEDLADFTGAGLNLTIFNVLDPAEILQGIKKVWASPYSERSYKWRQSYLLNPENVFPSILVIPSVDVDCSGVMITKGIANGQEDDVTVAFSRGAGGAVDGQAAEAYLLSGRGPTVLLSPARERMHRRLPPTGGSKMVAANFNDRILTETKLLALRHLARDVERIMPDAPGVKDKGPWDVELGFQNNRLWLFQIRPFVENKNAQSSAYLESISPALPNNIYFDLEYAL